MNPFMSTKNEAYFDNRFSIDDLESVNYIGGLMSGGSLDYFYSQFEEPLQRISEEIKWWKNKCTDGDIAMI